MNMFCRTYFCAFQLQNWVLFWWSFDFSYILSSIKSVHQSYSILYLCIVSRHHLISKTSLDFVCLVFFISFYSIFYNHYRSAGKHKKSLDNLDKKFYIFFRFFIKWTVGFTYLPVPINNQWNIHVCHMIQFEKNLK
jgi:hypothetical protein